MKWRRIYHIIERGTTLNLFQTDAYLEMVVASHSEYNNCMMHRERLEKHLQYARHLMADSTQWGN